MFLKVCYGRRRKCWKVVYILLIREDLFKNRRKILKMKIESEFVWIRALHGCNIACGICVLHAKPCRLQYRWGNLKYSYHLQTLYSLRPVHSTIPLSPQSNLVRRYL
jgi:hypothetical protein